MSAHIYNIPYLILSTTIPGNSSRTRSLLTKRDERGGNEWLVIDILIFQLLDTMAMVRQA